MANHLAGESSPYLLQHSGNPVDWYPWSPEAMRRARDEDKPVFLSIGYSACHWCHVMERESFVDLETADYLNDHFISIKVDREERPDLDDIYMKAVTALTGSGGWPLSAFLTPEGVPFYGGTYFPPAPRYGRPSFRQVLAAITDMWTTRRDDVLAASVKLRQHLAQEAPPPAAEGARAGLLAGARTELVESADPVNGGWGAAPKFPAPMALESLLAFQTVAPTPEIEQTVRLTLDSMAAGGIYDQLGGGFHRYSVDDVWLVPHFEKMLYDNAQLARCYLHASRLFSEPRYGRVAQETLDYLLRHMQSAEGGFFSAEDADSEGEEGAFYTWTLAQLRAALPVEQVATAARVLGVTEPGNFDGSNVLHLPEGAAALELPAESKRALLEARERRVRPARDEKVLAGWNGLALAALAEAGQLPGGERFTEASEKAGEFLVGQLLRDGDRLSHSWKDGRAAGNGFLEDYACVVEGLLALYATTFFESWFTTARALADSMLTHFARPEGGFYDTSDDHERLIVRPRSLYDSPTPCGNSMAASVLLRLTAYTGDGRYAEAAEGALAAASGLISRAPMMGGQWLFALLLAETGATEVAIVGDLATPAGDDFLQVVRSTYRPFAAVAARPASGATLVPILAGRELGPEEPAVAWVCRRSTCSPPTSHPKALEALLNAR